ncbi:MAG: hypothetical protein ACAH88_05890 [Roseimicrobium sp.]
MSVEFVWWGSSELLDRLSLPDNAGRVMFWFGSVCAAQGEDFIKSTNGYPTGRTAMTRQGLELRLFDDLCRSKS